MEPSRFERRLGLSTATMLVVASMVGTGVFTTTGFLVRDVGSGRAILLGWLLGGLLSLAGALAYAELVTALPANGGEYQLLGRIFHPSVGFLSGWASFVAGFSAPVGGTAIAFGEYLQGVFPGVHPTVAALGLIVVMTVVHSVHVSAGGRVQDVLTLAKILVIVVFIGAGVLAADPAHITEGAQPTTVDALTSPAFAVGLIYVSYAYAGWNAAAYVAGEVRRPARGLPLALLGGTLLVTLLYLGLNYVFLASAPPSDLSGVVRVGHEAAAHLWGEGAGRLVSAIIAAGLVSTVGALIMTGPRIYEAMGRDYPALAILAKRRAGGGPVVAILLQSAVAVVVVLTATYDDVLVYVGVTLSFFAALTVAGVFVLRWREPDLPRPTRAWGHPVTTILFIGLMLWMIGFTVAEKPIVALVALGTLLTGGVLYVALTLHAKRR